MVGARVSAALKSFSHSSFVCWFNQNDDLFCEYKIIDSSATRDAFGFSHMSRSRMAVSLWSNIGGWNSSWFL